MPQYSEKDPGETVSYGMDFGNVVLGTEIISTASVSVTTYTGTDQSAALSGAPELVGSVVRQIVSGGVDGSVYRLAFAVSTSSGQSFVGIGYIPCNIF